METIFYGGENAIGDTMTKTQENYKNAFWLRVYDVETLKSIYELYDTKQFESMNDLLNRAVRAGIEKMYIDYGKRGALKAPTAVPVQDSQKLDEIEKKLKEMSYPLDDVLVLMSMVEMITSTLYNIEVARLKGEAVSADLLESGYFSALPANLQEIKDRLIARMEKKKRK